MKQLFIVLTMLSFYFAKAHPAPIDIAPAAINSFNMSFKNASNSEWVVLGEIYRVRFIYENQLLYAFYNEQGERICIGRIISLQQLPPTLKVGFQKYVSGYKVAEVFEISNNNDVSYYITIVNEEHKIILKSSGIFNWSVFEKTKISK